MASTHEVLNQPPPLEGYNLFLTDPVLPPAVERAGAGWAFSQLRDFGARAGSAQVIEWGFLANSYPPVLKSHDRYGNRLDQVEYHPAYHRLMELSVATGVHSLAFEHPLPEGRYVARAALMYIDSQVEQGHGCPVSMTNSVLPALATQPDLADAWGKRILTRVYDPSFQPVDQKAGALLGMGMTEKQGGSDVRANTTRAVPEGTGGPGGEYRITGHKWFTSAPMCDAFLILAQASAGLSCFLLPRFSPDGAVNQIRVVRLKDKLGNRSNASAEVEFDQAAAWLVGEEGRGVRTIIEMVNSTRLDCVIGSAAIMRQAVTQAAHHVSHRSAFGKLLVEQPLMRNVVADLEVETQAAALLMIRVASAFDRASVDPREALLKRVLTPIAKYWVTKRCTEVVHEALECLGGNGYVEESILPRLFRESPLNAIWEGSGNVIALDVMRALARESGAGEALTAELEAARGFDHRLDDLVERAVKSLRDISDPEWEARKLVEDLAVAVQASLVLRHGSDALAEAFLATRVGGDWGRLYGTLPQGISVQGLLESALPQ